MTNANASNYARARELVRRGAWRVDPDAGLVCGQRGAPYRYVENGYVRIAMVNPFARVHAHRVIWEHVHGEIPSGLEVNHINAIKVDNRIVNLELVTSAGNVAHAVTMGLMPITRGAMNGRALLSDDDALTIYRSNERGVDLARMYGVDPATVCDIRKGRTWTHVTGHTPYRAIR